LQYTTQQIDRFLNIVIDDKSLVTLSNTEYRSLNTNQMRYGVSNLVNIFNFAVENKKKLEHKLVMQYSSNTRQ